MRYPPLVKRVPQTALNGWCTTTVNEPVHSKAYKQASMPREDSDQPAYSQSLISLYKYLLDTLWIAKDLRLSVQEDFDQTLIGMRRQSPCRNANYILILGTPVTYSRHDGKCNIYTFHEEMNAFEDWIFVRLSSRFLASEWTTLRRKFIVLISIDLWRQKIGTRWFAHYL